MAVSSVGQGRFKEETIYTREKDVSSIFGDIVGFWYI
jgi:hypothetical protein